jgi:hypothetical protein
MELGLGPELESKLEPKLKPGPAKELSLRLALEPVAPEPRLVRVRVQELRQAPRLVLEFRSEPEQMLGEPGVPGLVLETARGLLLVSELEMAPWPASLPELVPGPMLAP